MLIHGLWADPGSWHNADHPADGVKAGLKNAGYLNIGLDGYESFRGPSETMQRGETRLRLLINSLCQKEVKNNHLECTRADLVGHSMGGLVARKYIADNNYYRGIVDYGQGSVRRLLTIATPHSGSGFADFLMGDNDDIDGCVINGPMWLNLIRFIDKLPGKDLYEWDGVVPHFHSAFHDLELGDGNPLLPSLNGAAQQIPVFSIIGDTGTQLPDFGLILYQTGCSHHEIFHDEHSDRIVPVSSAEGGLPSINRMPLQGIWHVGMGMNIDIATAVRDKLEGPRSAFASEIHPSFATGVAAAGDARPQAFSSTAGRATLADISESASAFTLTLSPSATILAPGTDLVFTAAHDGVVIEAMVLADDTGNTWSDDAAPWEWTLPTPVSAAGVRTYKAVAIIDGEVVESNTVVITILPEMAGLEQLDFQPAEQTLLFQGSDEQLVLLGKFADDESRDVTNPAMGTTYHERIVDGVEITEGDSPVLDVTADGKVTALASGTADVVAVNGSVTTVRRFVVVERPPTVAEARDDAATAEANHAVTIEVLENDIGDGALEVTGVGTPANGAATHDGTTVTYTPPADWSGTDEFTYTITDALGATATATVGVTVHPVPAALILVTPVTWDQGSRQTISWRGTVVTGKVSIQLFKGTVLKATISTGTANDGAFDWTVPPTLPVGSDYKLKVAWLGNPAVIKAWSDQFPVIAPTLTVGQPGGTGTVMKGSLQPIRWAGPVGGKVKIQLFKGAVLKTTTAAKTPNDGVFDWVVPTTLVRGKNFQVRVTWLSDSAFTDESASFTVVAPTMTVNQPVGAEIWDQQSTRDVTWSCGKGFGNVKIELYKGTALFKTLAASTPNTGVKTITVPAVLATASKYRVKVTWLPNPRIFGWSGGFITVR